MNDYTRFLNNKVIYTTCTLMEVCTNSIFIVSAKTFPIIDVKILIQELDYIVPVPDKYNLANIVPMLHPTSQWKDHVHTSHYTLYLGYSHCKCC